MKLKNLLAEKRAVSPVIGVILMVAITVILAAVIGTFVLGLGDSVSSTTPQATYGWSYDSANGDVDLRHKGGDSVPVSQLTFQFNDGSGDAADDSIDTDASLRSAWDGDSNGKISAGESVTFTDQTTTADTSFESGDEIVVLWTSDTGDSSSVLNTFEIP